MNISLRISALLLFTFLFSFDVAAQHKYTLADFYKADSIANQAKPKDALALIKKINKQARQTHNLPLFVKSVIYRMMFQSYLEENAFDQILVDLREDINTAKQPEKSILQSLLAETYWNYLQQNRWQINQGTQVQGDIGDNIKTWSIKKLNDETVKYYLLSLKEHQILQQIKVDTLDAVLAGDKTYRSFRPTLYDLLAHRAIDVFSNTQIGLTQYDDQLTDMSNVNWFGDRKTFLNIPVPIDSTSFKTQALQLFQNLIRFHQNGGNSSALADVDLKRLKFIQQHFTGDSQELYYNALSQLAEESTQSEVFADILYEQAVIHKNAQLPVDSNKQNLIKAVALAEKAIKNFPKSIGAKNARHLIEEIKSSSFLVKVKEFGLPDQPSQLYLSYKNTDTVQLSLYHAPDFKNEYEQFNNRADFLAFLRKNKATKQWVIAVPKTNDYQTHSLIDKMEGLPFGSYTLIAQTINREQTDTIYSNINFKVTAMAVINRRNIAKHEYFVSQLNNGAPLKNVKIQQRRYDYSTRKFVNGVLIITNDKGYASTPETDSNMSQAVVTFGKDELKLNINNYNSYQDDKDEEEERVILFADRPIYRPGQTIYYKGLCLNILNGKNKIAVNKAVDISFNDANGKEITKTKLVSNDYGTFQGSFAIPMGILNGQMEIETEYGRIAIQVEEYKRPTFEVVFDKPNKHYKLNDSIKVSAKASSFSGYSVSNAKVNYKVFRNLIYDYRLSYGQRNAIYGSGMNAPRKQVAIGKTNTKADGKFEITFFASATDINANYSYEIVADVTDLNGETRSKTINLTVGKKDIMLNISTEQVVYLSNKADSISFSVTNLNHEPIKADVKAEWSLLQAPSRLMNKSPFYAENYAMSKEDFIKNFPHDDYDNELEVAKWPVKSVEFKQNLSAKNGLGNLTFSKKDLKPGYYKISLTAVNGQSDTVKLDKYLVIYHEAPAVIQSNIEWITPEVTVIKPNESAVFRLAGLAENSKAYYEVYYRDSIAEKVWINLSPKQTIVKIQPKANYEDGFAVQFTMVHQGTVYNSMQQVKIVDPQKELNIRFLTFRNKLQPGEKESWKLQISNSNGEKQMAEMVATLYDASLDDLKQMDWNTNLQNSFNYGLYNWNFNVNNVANPGYLWFLRRGSDYGVITRGYENLNLFGYNYYGGYNSGYRNYISNLQRAKRKGLSPEAVKKLAELEHGKLIYGVVFDHQGEILPGVQVSIGKKVTTTNVFGIYTIDGKAGETLHFSYIGYKNYAIKIGSKKRVDATLKEDGTVLREVVVTGYGAQKKQNMTGSVVQIRGMSTLQGRAAGLSVAAPAVEKLKEEAVAVDDTGTYDFVSINSYDPKTGLEIINGKPVIKKTNITARTNFNELAFFYPQLLTDAKGEIKIEFTIPQSLTRYKMMGFAHTKDLKTASITNELVTQKQLAIAINAPRFFREGDTILLSAKLNNLAGKKLVGNASLGLTDALTGKPVQIFEANEKSEKTFEVDDAGNTVLKWALIIPSGISAITYKVLAQSGKFSDGEENTIPVLANAMLVTESMPINVRGNITKTFDFEKLEKSGASKTLRNQSLTFEFTSNPVWYAVQALPYLMEYPYECAEQTFSRFYANSFATGIINSSPKIKKVFEQWKNTNNGEALLSNLEKNQELKSILLEETPWVRNANNESERKKRLATLFDLNRMTYELKNNFEKLEKMQFNNGAFPWFNGMQEDRYITQHIVLGMGQLKKLKLIDEKAYPNFNAMLNKAIIYLDAALVQDYKNEVKGKHFAYLPLHYLFARSYTDQKNTSADFVKAKDFYLKKLVAEWKTFDTYQLAQAALVLSRNGNNVEAKKIINLLSQTAQQNDEIGMYWATNKAGWWWYQSPIETQASVIEAFDEVANDTKAVEEMKIWLLKNKQTNDWKTTKATVAACYALLMKGTDLLTENNEPEITIGGQKLVELQQPNATKEAGTGYQKVSISGANVKPEMGQVEVKNNNQTIAWGALYWQYFEQLDKITSANTGVKIKKQLFIQKASDKGDVLTALTTSNVLAPGDLLKVRIEIYCDRDMEYIHLKDMRSSGFEPVNVISQYKYQDGLGYYESTKDASTNFFISYMPKGTYVFEYPLRVTHAGNFSNGITSLQSMYAPEFTTHSAGIRVSVK
ncbi:CarboxypepD_reg-like domain-containing protein [Pedobacter terrae]|uniref:CarboxypepD_reg-like domain-containing protein n=1 Tax=Pedobacter terrae TaxID=405671 RepID=A0A1G7X155_9SPHI|nr:MG2 domain-containing protein [Pedobacter terrae]SDG77876.1 CarboxypepD_reg-like domain-containing protein [Pedobacter terrae]